ncbi:MAG TPA: ROK family protein [Terracidiphilus sp.]|jgi:predicted NBD/HSP70 family sugar kinase|nr:ROK family protein [Terracidiphilus sp.]
MLAAAAPEAGEIMIPTPGLLLEENQSASNRTPRQINRSLIFNQIRSRQPISRAELARTSGLQRSTVSLIVEKLLGERWIVEGSLGEIPRGRKPTFLLLNPQRGVLALDVHPAQTMLAVADLCGNISDERQIVLPADPNKVIGAILSAVKRLIAAHQDRIFEGIGINFPGRFSHQLDKTIFAPNVEWPIAQIRSRVEQATGLPVVVENVANACALSEVWFGNSEATRDLVVVNVSEGIGAGIFANGRLLRGDGDAAGEFGHVQLDPNGVVCGCGSRGCWETIASNRAAMRYYNDGAKEPIHSFEALLQLAEANDQSALKAITKMCTGLGRGMHMLVSALAPCEIVVVGELTRLWPLVFPIIDAELRRFPLIRLPRIRIASGPDKARLRSAVPLIMNDKSI